MSLKTPITYYGGKQNLVPFILDRIPPHTSYTEVFAGGAAIFWAKDRSEIEVLNDTNKELINFYRVVQEDFVSLEKYIRITLHSRDLHRKAWVIYNNADMFNEIKRAWAVWVLSSQSFSGLLDGSWRYDKTRSSVPKTIQSKKEHFTEDLAIRLQNVHLECADALYIIKSRDTADTFFYVDPPYYNADAGHYKGYTLQDFNNLLSTLSSIKGKFLLSSYPSETLSKYQKENRWHSTSLAQKATAHAKKDGNCKRKIEVFTANYSLRADKTNAD